MTEFEPFEPRGGIEREVDRLTQDTVERMLRGDAKDYTAYASLVARHRVLGEMKNFIANLRKQGETLDSD
jgi:hypothetical protein